jgi:hypothetical protein
VAVVPVPVPVRFFSMLVVRAVLAVWVWYRSLLLRLVVFFGVEGKWRHTLLFGLGFPLTAAVLGFQFWRSSVGSSHLSL